MAENINKLIANTDMMGLMLVLGWAIVFLLVFKAQVKSDHFDLRCLIMEDGKVSLSKFSQFVALGISTWAFAYQTLHDTLTEFYFIGYMVTWSGSRLLMAYISKKPDQSKET